ncbi:hypothetical protein [Pseudolysobacter antarcticus]|uniref:hypothetical protein n=1 Tax=Pseudolysobacter antarcticus TaxID=2511995 RepID=UPI0013EDC2FC|nr:hypothetical protein [Pseudolysobacter antarcticus]
MIVYFIPSDEIGSAIVDVQRIATEVSAAAQRAADLKYPTLRILLGGWQSVP